MINLAVKFPKFYIGWVHIVKIRTQDNRQFETKTAFEQ